MANGFSRREETLGSSDPECIEEGVRWITIASDQGLAEAQTKLAGFKQFGRFGFDKDTVSAFALYELAADQGHADAQFALGMCYFEGAGVELNVERAVFWFKAAEQNHCEAQLKLGLGFDNGTGVIVDAVAALSWYMKAADQGHLAAQFNVGVCYDNGLGVEQTAATAAEWYLRAAEQGDAHAQYSCGYCAARALVLQRTRGKHLSGFFSQAKANIGTRSTNWASAIAAVTALRKTC